VKKLSLCCCTTFLLTSSAYAANIVDFESIPGASPSKGMEISTQYQNTNGITFSSSNRKIILVKVGEKPPLSFVSRYNSSGIKTSKENQPNRAAPNSKVGQFMLWTRGRLTITYTNPVAKAYGDIIDIDYSEKYTVIARNINGKEVSRKVFNKNSSGAGDGIATRWSFDLPKSTIKTVQILKRGGGFAFDNFSSSTTTNNCQSKKIAPAYTRTGAGESLVAPFTSPSTSTTKSYSGLVEVIVSGTGYSYGMTVNDAFFGVKTGKPLDPQYYQLNLGWNAAPLKPYSGESRNIANFIKFVDGMGKAAVPTYNSNNRYHFVIEVPKDAGRLSFGVSDGGFDENGGQYNIKVYPIKNQVVCNSADSKVDKKLGCFKDQGDSQGTRGRDLNGLMWSNAEMTTEKCQEHCKTRGYAYAGTQYSYQCFCGNSYGRSGTASNCNMPCKGNKSQTCGGVWANSVYKLAK
jgi:hypothetical protein